MNAKASSAPVHRLMSILVERGQHTAVVDAIGHRTVTYEGLRAFADTNAAQLTEVGCRAGDRIGILLPNSFEALGVYLACLWGGFTAVPVNLDQPDVDIAYAFEMARVRAIVTDADGHTRSPVEAHRQRGPVIAAVHPSPGRLEVSSAASSDVDRLLSITFTSGTTSRPKGVAHTSRTLLTAAEEFNRALGFDSRVRLLHVLPMSYMAGFLNTILCPLVAGGTIVLAPRFDSGVLLRFWHLADEHDINALWLTPTIASALVQFNRGDRGREYCRKARPTICIGTAPLTTQLRRDFTATFGAELYESYGLSELLFISTQAPGLDNRNGSPGELLDGVVAKTADDDEIVIASPFAMAGYLDADTGQPTAPPSWFSTGDIGRIDGRVITITGRKKDLIITGGINVSPRAIEELLAMHTEVVQAAVVGVPHPLKGERVVAFLVLGAEAVASDVTAQLDRLCRQQLMSAAVPDVWHVLEHLPLNLSGKVQKSALRQIALEAASPS